VNGSSHPILATLRIFIQERRVYIGNETIGLGFPRIMIDEHVFDLLPGYALGVLSEAELLQVARHLPTCPGCRAELASFWPVVDQLPLAVPLQTPPRQLRDKIIARAESLPRAAAARSPFIEPEPAPRSAAKPAPEPRRRGFADWFGWLTARPAALAFAVLALVLIFLAANNLFLRRQVNELAARIPGSRVRIVQMAGTGQAPQAQGYLMIFKQEQYGTLVVEDVPSLEQGYQYQLWLVKDGKRSSGGVFSVNAWGYGTLQIAAEMPLDQYVSFGVTVEPAGGSPGPTGKKVLGGGL
jgi:anti-sigma-K factor RskA